MAADLSGVGLASPTLRGGTYGGVTVVRGRWRGPADTPGLLAVATAGRPRSVDRPLRAHVARCRRNGGATQRSGWCAERGGGRRRPALSGPGPGAPRPGRRTVAVPVIPALGRRCSAASSPARHASETSLSAGPQPAGNADRLRAGQGSPGSMLHAFPIPSLSLPILPFEARHYAPVEPAAA